MLPILSKYIQIIYFIIITFTSSLAFCKKNHFSPNDFVNIHDIDPSIQLNLKYHQNDNIIGQPFASNDQEKAIISVDAAKALSEVQEELIAHGYSLVIYDSYHPHKTYKLLKNAFHKSKDIQSIYNPTLSNEYLKQQKFIKIKYAHARGSTVDATIIPLKKQLIKPSVKQIRYYKNNQAVTYLHDGSVDMGTSHDTLDPLSAHSNTDISIKAQENRKLLKTIMQNHGFIADKNFWWQYTLAREPYADSRFDFDI